MARPPASPEPRSSGAESLSAPSEYLAEFLSAIMRRQYAEALKYCRLILQYEPHNATARGFYPLLRLKVRRSSVSVDSSDGSGSSRSSLHSGAGEAMEHTADSPCASPGGAACDVSRSYASSQSSLELDPSPAHSSRSSQGSEAGPRDRTDSSGWLGVGVGGGGGGSGGDRWSSSDSSPRDGNGNTYHTHTSSSTERANDSGADAADLQNDNAPAAAAAAVSDAPRPQLKHPETTESWTSLRRLRARFAAIK